jgi:hypothetical protein
MNDVVLVVIVALVATIAGTIYGAWSSQTGVRDSCIEKGIVVIGQTPYRCTFEEIKE